MSPEPAQQRQRSAGLDGTVDLARDRDLVERCQDGDRTAFEELYHRYHRRLFHFCLRRLHEPYEAEDAVLRKQSWRDFLTASKAAGDLTVLELRESGIKPKELDNAFETVCLYEDVEFPPGLARRPDTAAGFQAHCSKPFEPAHLVALVRRLSALP